MQETILYRVEPTFTTPDLDELQKAEEGHLLFDPKVRKSDKIVCSAFSVEKLSLYTRTEDNLPLPIRIRGQHRARIGGALYRVTTKDIVGLDKMHQNRLLFERREVEVYVPIWDVKRRRAVMVMPRPAFFYSAIAEVWEERLDMSSRKYNLPVSEPEFRLARTYVDNEPILNNHFRMDSTRPEDFNPAVSPVLATEEVVAYVKRKNDEAVAATRANYEAAYKIVEEEEYREARSRARKETRDTLLKKIQFWKNPTPNIQEPIAL